MGKSISFFSSVLFCNSPFLILICVGIYAVLIQSVAVSDDAIASIWGIVGYTVLLCFTLFKTSSIAKSVLNAH